MRMSFGYDAGLKSRQRLVRALLGCVDLRGRVFFFELTYDFSFND